MVEDNFYTDRYPYYEVFPEKLHLPTPTGHIRARVPQSNRVGFVFEMLYEDGWGNRFWSQPPVVGTEECRKALSPRSEVHD